ncbi:hypothetical protein GGR51DRAFT_524438 [Nemania sp. FL0031]|nr:hypothetical protein GGR51DRAFT_524438 [Nemania sp. FL0031]
MLTRKRFVTAALILVAGSFALFTLNTRVHLPDAILPNGVPGWRHQPLESASPLLPELSKTGDISEASDIDEANEAGEASKTDTSNAVYEPVSPVPLEYYSIPGDGETCSRFSPTYFEDFHALAASYCEPDSPAKLTCFHRPSGFDGKTDSFCHMQGAKLNLQTQKFHLDCELRNLTEQEKMNGILPFSHLPAYWYETGPAYVFALAVNITKGVLPYAGSQEEVKHKREQKSSLISADQPLEKEVELLTTPPKTILLLKREGEGNPWHSIIEIFSTYMTFDILRMPQGIPGQTAPIFRHPIDSDDTQIVILDDRPDGPYFNLWTLFARRKPMRFHELLADQSIANSLSNVNLVVPLAGSSNPFWKEDDQAEQCTNSPLLDVFSQRVLDFYGIKTAPFRSKDKPIVVTFVKRRDSRRIKNQDALFTELGRRNSHIRIQMVDFAAVPFPEQLRIAQETDILVAAHGAGLTHAMFMRQNAGAVVEIQPRGLDHHGFKNVIGMRGLGYFRVHAKIIPLQEEESGESENATQITKRTGEIEASDASGRADGGESYEIAGVLASTKGLQKREEWHLKDLEIEDSIFFEAVEAAIKFMYNQGPWSFDVTD